MTASNSQSPAVDEALEKASKLATLPQVTTRILELLDAPNATAEQLETLVSSDPILSARVLKVVNSSFYGMPAAVSSIKQAIVLLGMGGLRNIALAASLAKLFGGRQTQGDFDPQGPWQHSAAVAATAKMICAEIGEDAETVFLAGLLHDVGTLVAMQALRNEFSELMRSSVDADPATYSDREREFLGATHEEFGAALCRKWNFPQVIQAVVEFHHHPEQLEGEQRRVAQIIGIADSLVAEADIGLCCGALPAPAHEADIESLGLQQEQIEDIVARLPEAAQAAASLAGA